ncbi:nucleoside hydrolase [Chitinophaga japonensis]|uniref:Inosine-uridine preferring nucleoside hydrolase n=1 Tax=Chitinophaga japonensis TaxID=104662 RepID=A0A562TCB1_CHIJA|nr:nucleoside hydrolase [Chitinophaga japonensis]TWI90918.1 inosine-uridine preferring nucleoside hydrolase [Chitinophaga japonensis]
MKDFLKVMSVVIIVSLFSTGSIAQPVKIIFDTDMESDVDDVGALAMLHGLADLGEAEILGTMVCSLNPWSVPATDAINTFCHRPDVPVGAVKTLGVYRNSVYARAISEEFPQDIGLGEEAPDALMLYRQLLAAQPDQSVVIVTVGYLTNLSYLLQSAPDTISPLNGKELVRKKVKHLVCMGGRYPYEQNPGKWGNFKPDPGAVQYVAKEWPTRIIFTGGGDFSNAIKTGRPTFDLKPSSNPVSRAYELFLKSWKRKYHHSADLIAVYVAVRGWEAFFHLNTQGYNHIFEDGTMMWRLQPDDPRHQYISSFKEGIDPDTVAAAFDALMMKPVSARLH